MIYHFKITTLYTVGKTANKQFEFKKKETIKRSIHQKAINQEQSHTLCEKPAELNPFQALTD